MLGLRSSKKKKNSPGTGDGPYRSGDLTPPRRRLPRWVLVPIAALLGGWLVAHFWKDEAEITPTFADAPAVLVEPFATFPFGQSELPVAAPLDPLLAADQPEQLAILAPPPGAQRLQRGQTLTFRFNRPMVEGAQVGEPLVASPLEFTPAVRGRAYWASRSRLVFEPAPQSWNARGREARVQVAAWVRALDGSSVLDEDERVVVFDGTPHLARSDTRTVAPGEALPLYFDNPVSAAELARDLMAYEMGGASRSVPVRVTTRGTEEALFRVDLRPGRRLEEGARIGVAIAPRWTRWGGGSPSTVQFRVQPPPHLEGVGCPERVAHGRCEHGPRPGRIVDIGPALRVRASERTASPTLANVSVTPALPGLEVRHADPEGRTIEVRGEWAADQVYEVRLRDLRTQSGRALRRFSPLAVRSAGHRPEVRLLAQATSWESDAAAALHFRAIHIDKGAAIIVPVTPGQAMLAALDPTAFLNANAPARVVPLHTLAPDARPNRWGRGYLDWTGASTDASATGPRMAVVGLRPGSEHPSRRVGGRLLQRTDVGLTARVLPDGVLVFATSLRDASPVAGARVLLGTPTDEGQVRVRLLGDAETGADGVAFVRTAESAVERRVAVVAQTGDQAAVLVVEPNRALPPSHFMLAHGTPAPADGAPRASVFADRGAYRPGERVRVHALVREARRVDARFEVRPHREEIELRLRGPLDPLPVASRRVTPTEFGSADAEFELPPNAALGQWTLEVVRYVDPASGADALDEEEDAPREPTPEFLGQSTLQVAEFRQPTFRVDVDGPSHVHAGEPLRFATAATYLFGADVQGEAEWSLVSDGAPPRPRAQRDYDFAAIEAHASHQTHASGRGTLEDGALAAESRAWSSPVRTRAHFEVSVRDATGQTTARRHALTVHPAAVEVGIRRDADWVALGEELSAHALAVDTSDAPVASQPVQARFYREGWHRWWAWSPAARHREDGYRLRRERRAERAHACSLTTDERGEGHCGFVPERPGTYRVELEVEDAEGRTHLASRRVYVAGPDEAPDRDPPGTVVSVTPTRPTWSVGETAELAFESPWPDGEALITVEREGVLHQERRSLSAGAQVVRVPVTEAMIPNAFVSVTMVRGRSAEPQAAHDLGAPDLRVGMAELEIKPEGARYEVAVEAPSDARPGQTVEVAAQVTNAAGAPVRAEVTLWMVDEGLLRLTDYAIADPTAGLFPRLGARFTWEDLRRALASRVAPEEVRGGGGGGGSSERTLRPDAPIPDPVPLFMTAVADEHGRVRAQVTLPDRPTEYRVLALAVDDEVGFGSNTAQVVASQPVVLTDALPRFVTAGDDARGAIFVHAAESLEAPVTGTLVVHLGDEEHVREAVELAPGASRRVEVPLRATGRDDALRVRAELAGVNFEQVVPVAPRGHWRRQVAVGGAALGEHAHELTVRIPAAERGALRVHVAPHPFVGSAASRRELEQAAWGHVQHRAAVVLAFAAERELAETDPSAEPVEVIEARARDAIRQLLFHQRPDGAFGRWDGSGWAHAWETTWAARALVRAHDAGLAVPAGARERALRAVRTWITDRSFDDGGAMHGADAHALALHVLTEGGAPYPEGVDALFERRDQLGVAGLAHLALAMEDDDVRRDALAADAVSYALDDHSEDDALSIRLRLPRRDARELGPALEVASATASVFARAGELAGRVLERVRPGVSGIGGFAAATEAGEAWTGLAAFARAFVLSADSHDFALALDGRTLQPDHEDGVRGSARSFARGFAYTLDASSLAGDDHVLRFEGDHPVFFSVQSDWVVPLGPNDRMARGRRVALHRRFETADGRTLAPGDTVALGEMIRVRLFTFSERPSGGAVRLFDPLAAGAEPVQAQFATSPASALDALLGVGPDDEVRDPRGYHAYRSAHAIARRAMERNATVFYFDELPTGLQEFTYAVRATAPGTFTLPPAQMDGADPGFVGRSTAFELTVRADGDAPEDSGE